MKPRPISATDLCAKYGLQRPNLSALIREGLPIASTKQSPRGGPPRLFFIEQVFLEWIAEHGREDAVTRILGDASEGILARLTAQAPKQIQVGKDGTSSYTWDKATNNVGAMFVMQWAGVLRIIKQRNETPAANTKDLLDLVKAERHATTTMLKTYDTLRRGTKDSAAIAKTRGEVAPIKDMERRVREMARAVREGALRVPSRATERMVDEVLKALGLSVDPEQKQAALAVVNQLLAAEMRVLLSALAGEDPEGKA